MKDITILAIETSCDETAAALVRNGRQVLSSVVASQIKTHAQYGGVVPEIASRKHLEAITLVTEKALAQGGAAPDAVAVTNTPGLVGALLVGVAYAKALAFSMKIPIIGINHLEGHICACYLEDGQFAPPFTALVVSGGHTLLARVEAYGRYTVLGRTRDDAAGEAFDKVARALGLPYPGGPALEALAAAGAPVLPFPRVWLEPGSLDFSFSGLKSAVVNTLRRPGPAPPKADVAASFQAAAIDVLVGKTAKALAAHGGPAALAGGVAQNQALRQALTQACAKLHIPLKIPKGAYCADNAAMIGACGYFKYLGGCRDTLALNAYPTMMRGDL